MTFALDPYNLETFPEQSFIKTGHQPPQNHPGPLVEYNTEYDRHMHVEAQSYFSRDHWKYSEKNTRVEYKHNSDGFRCPDEFDDIDWSNTSVLVGCSYVCGDGCENENTITELLTREYGERFINGGQPGAGNRAIHHNAITFMKKYNPKKVIILWSYHQRYVWLRVDQIDGNQYWHAEYTTPQQDKRTQRQLVKNYDIPPAYHKLEGCQDSIHQWKTAVDIHNLLGNKQYHVSHKYPKINTFNDDRLWIKPKDTTLYDRLFLDDAPGPKFTREELQTPEPYDMINKLGARDMSWCPVTGLLKLGHYGEQMNRDIADLIYRENFK